MKQYADWLADWAYEAPIIELKALTLESDGLPSIHMGTQMITGNWRKQIQEEIRLNNSKRLAEKNVENWGMCPEDISWHRMLGTTDTEGIYNRLKMAQIMHGKRTTKDLLHKFKLIDEPSCDMCGERAETNEHVLCHCIATQCTFAKGKVATMMVQNIQSNGGDRVTQDMMATIYGTTDTGAAVDRQVEYDVSTEIAQVKNAPENWRHAYEHRGETEPTFQSVADAWAYEHLLRLGGNMPLWTGVITKQLLLLLKWGGVRPNNMTHTIKQMRHILAAHAKVVWKNRCETVYSPENEAKRVQRTKEKMATRVIQETRATGYITATEVMSMTSKQKAQLRHNMMEDGKIHGRRGKLHSCFSQIWPQPTRRHHGNRQK